MGKVGGAVLDVVAGCGPAGLHLAAVMAKKGINVGFVDECMFDQTHQGGGAAGGAGGAMWVCKPAASSRHVT